MNMNQQYTSWTVANDADSITATTVLPPAELFIQSTPSVEITPPIQRSSLLDTSNAIGIIQDTSVASSFKLAQPTPDHRTELVFIEGNVADYQQLVASIGAGKEIHLLDASKDGLQQIASVLEGRSNVDALHIISHGSNGNINLGALTLNNSNLGAHSQELQVIENALTKDADILLYGCDVAQQDDHHFLDSLAIVTGADIAASNNLTGSAQAGGDWNLEVHSGNIESVVAVNPQLAALYSHVLNIASATITFTATSNNILNYGSKNNASTDFLYKVNGNTNYQLKIDGATRGVYEYVNPGDYVLLDAAFSNETSVTFSFKDNNVFTANSIYISNYELGFASQNLEFRGYDASNSIVGSVQQITVAQGVSPFTKITFTGLTDITKLVLTENGTNSNLLHYLAIDTLALSNIKAAVTAPVITTVTQSSGNGYYNVNNSNPVLISVTFDQAVTVNAGGGTPRLQLETGTVDEYANYVSGSGTNVLTFSYQVQAGDTSADLQYLSTAALSLNGGTIKLTSDGTTAATLTLPALGSGSSLAGSSAVIIDTTAPSGSTPDLAAGSDSGSSSTDNITNDTTPTFTGSTEANASVALFDTDGTTQIGTTTADGSGNWSITASVLSEGAHTIYTKVTDLANNTSSLSTSLGITIDTTAPAIGTPDLMNASDSGVSSSDNLTNKTTPNFTDTAEASSTVTLYDTDGTTVLGTTTANGMGKWTITSSLLSEGVHMVSAKATDTAGNISSASSKLTITVDTTAPVTAPDAPTLDNGTDSGVSNSDQITNFSDPCFNGTGADANSWVNVYADGSLLGTTLSDGSGNFTYRATFLADGVHLITSKNVDNAGNIGPASSALTVTIDMTTPTTTIATIVFSNDTGASNTDFITKTAAQTISGTTSANIVSSEIVEVSLDNGGTWTTATTSVGVNTWSLSGQTLVGSNTLRVRVSDLAGNAASPTSQAYVLDTTAPTTTIATLSFSADTGSSSTDFITKTAAQTISGTTSANIISGETVEVSLNNGSTWTSATTSIGSNTWSLSGQTLVSSDTLKVRITDTAGNSGTVASQAYVLDQSAPSAPSNPDLTAGSDTGISNTDDITDDTTPTLTGTAEANATITLFDTNGTTQLGTATADGSGNWNLTSSTLANGVHTFTVKASDAAGNISVASGSLNVTINVPVVVNPNPNPPVTSTVDGIQISTVTTIDAATGITNSVITIPTVTSSRIEDPTTPNRLLADIPLGIQSTAGNTTLTVSLPVNFGLQADGTTRLLSNSEALLDLTRRIDQHTSAGSTTQIEIETRIHDYLASLNSQTVIQSKLLTFTSAANNAAENTLFIDGFTPVGQMGLTPLTELGTAPPPKTTLALVLDTHLLGINTIVQTNDVSFITVIGNINLLGDGRPNFVVGDDANQHIFLNSLNNQIYAGAGNDVISSAAGSDILDGGSGNDIVVGGNGDDQVIGGSGDDVIVGGRSDAGQWNFYLGANGVVGQHTNAVFAAAASEMVETGSLNQRASDFAFLHANNTQLTNLALLYQGAFGRIADLDGFNYWLTSGADIKTIAAQFLLSNEWASSGQAQLSDTAFIQDVYTQALGRAPDAAGLAYWLAQLTANPGNAGRANVLTSIALSQEHLNQATSSNGITLVEQNVTQERGWIAHSGDDILNGGLGNDAIQGGDGTDTILYDGVQSDYQIRVASDGQIHIVDSRNGDVDTISGIEQASFGNTTANTTANTINTPIDFSFTEAAPDSLRTLGLLYQSLFDRAADLGGLRYWLSQSTNAQSLANQFVQTSEFIADFNTLSQAQFVHTLFQNTGLQSSAAGGEAFWENYLTTHTRAELIATWIHNDTVVQTLTGTNGIWVA